MGQVYQPTEWYSIEGEEDLKAFTSALKGLNVSPVCDVVLNHRSGTGKADCNGGYLQFSQPDWNSTAVVSDDQKQKDQPDLECSSPCKCGAKDTGENQYGVPDVDHASPKIRQDVVDFLNFLRNDLGFSGWRFDMVKGFAGKYTKEYWDRTGGGFFVGEFKDGIQTKIEAWIAESGLPVFDFPQRGILKKILSAGPNSDFSGLRTADGPQPGIAGKQPAMAQALLDDHDTARPPDPATGGDGGFGTDDQQMLGYAYILTHPPFPWVFLRHLDGANGAAIKKLVSLRRKLGILASDTLKVVEAKQNLYAALVGGTGDCDAKVAVKLGSEVWSAPSCGGLAIAASGEGWAVWSKGGSDIMTF